MHVCSFDTRKKIRNENFQRKFYQESSNLPFAVPGNVKLKLPIRSARRGKMDADKGKRSLRAEKFASGKPA